MIDPKAGGGQVIMLLHRVSDIGFKIQSLCRERVLTNSLSCPYFNFFSSLSLTICLFLVQELSKNKVDANLMRVEQDMAPL